MFRRTNNGGFTNRRGDRGWRVAAFVLPFSLLGAIFILSTLAATPTAHLEAEQGTLLGNTKVVTVANASSGAAVQFGGPTDVTAKAFGIAAPKLPDQTPAVQEQWLSDMQSLGVTWLRIDISWWRVQPQNASTYDWSSYDQTISRAQAHGMRVLGIIAYAPPWARSSQCTADFQCQPADPQAYASFARATVEHFGDNLGAVEIWNEPNLTQFWHPAPNAAAYATMLKAAHTAIKTVKPAMPVLTGGMSPACNCGTDIAPITFLQALYANGAKGSFDVVGHHPYSYPAPPADIQNWSGWSQMNDTNPSLRSVMIANGEAAKPIWITEVGAPTGGPGTLGTCSNTNYAAQPDHTDECLQALIASQAITLSKSYSWSGVTFYYSYLDEGTSGSTIENFFGLLRRDGSRKPSYEALKDAISPSL